MQYIIVPFIHYTVLTITLYNIKHIRIPYVNMHHHLTIYLISYKTHLYHNITHILICIHTFHIGVTHIFHVHYLYYTLHTFIASPCFFSFFHTYIYLIRIRFVYAPHTYTFHICRTCICSYLCITCICQSYL